MNELINACLQIIRVPRTFVRVSSFAGDGSRCASAPCQHNGSCSSRNVSYTCSCAQGWGGGECELDVDDCVSKPCHTAGATRCDDLLPPALHEDGLRGGPGYTCACLGPAPQTLRPDHNTVATKHTNRRPDHNNHIVQLHEYISFRCLEYIRDR